MEQERKQKKKEKLICVDWLKICFLYELPDLNNNKTYHFNCNCYIEYTPNSSKYFASIVNLWIGGIKIGEIEYNPTSPFIQKNIVHFKFENHLLYTKNFTKYVDYMVEVLKFKYQYISRIDISIDCVNHDLLKFIKKYMNSKNIRQKGRVNDISIKASNCTKQYHTIYYGAMRSDKYIKIYNKTQELKKSEKDYVKHFYDLNGLDYHNNDVERIELTLKRNHAKLIQYKKLLDCNYLASIIHTHFKNYFQFIAKYKQHQKYVNKDITPITLNDYYTELLPKYKYVQKHSIKAQKMELKRLYINILLERELLNNIEVEINEQSSEYVEKIDTYFAAIKHFRGSIKRILRLYDLNGYYKFKKSTWATEFKKNKMQHLNKITDFDNENENIYTEHKINMAGVI